MIGISMGSVDLSDSFLRRIVQLGVDCVDLGCPPLDGLSALKKRVRSFGLDVNSVFLPDMSAAFMGGDVGPEKELDAVERTLRAYGDAGLRLVFQRFEGNNFNHLVTFYESVHRGGYRGSGKSVWLTGSRPPQRPAEEIRRARMAYWPHFGYDEPPDRSELDAWWGQFCRVFERLVPIAEEYEMRIGVHPADLPLADAPFGTLGFHRVIDAFPSRNVGYLYCCGTWRRSTTTGARGGSSWCTSATSAAA
jgi:mannonate dehydratase